MGIKATGNQTSRQMGDQARWHHHMDKQWVDSQAQKELTESVACQRNGTPGETTAISSQPHFLHSVASHKREIYTCLGLTGER